MHTVITRREKPLQAGLESLAPILQRVFSNRDVNNTEALELGLGQLHHPTQFMGLDAAVARIEAALQQQQRILIVGDFDADGATSSALAVSCLRAFGGEHVEYLVPNRFAYGYGLTPEIVDFAASWRPDVIITVDNGISSVAGVARAKEHNIDVIVTDHHLPGDELPDAVAIVNPNQVGDDFPSKCLAGVGVIFYVMSALRRQLVANGWFTARNQTVPSMAEWLDLVALGTVADVVPLDHNNRILVHQGLQRIRQGRVRPGIKALIDVSGRDLQRLCAQDFGFAIAPRLNAAGRLDDMSLGVDCLLTTEHADALTRAETLNELNQERRQIEQDMQEQALTALEKIRFVEEDDLPLGLCLFDESWHQGVIGILAGRIKERYHRPVIVFAAADEDEVKGSARSINGVHIRDVLDVIAKAHPHLITKFGGHAMAAGLSLAKKHLAEFTRVFADTLSQFMSYSDCRGEIISDGPLDANDFNLQTAQLLRDAGPWGQHFPEPIFDNEFVLLQQRLLADKHLKCVLQLPGHQQMINAIAFNVDNKAWPNLDCRRVHAAYQLDINEYQGIVSPQLIIRHLDAL